MYQIFRMLFPLNNDTLILFLAKKLLCAGNEVVACVKKAEYEQQVIAMQESLDSII